MNEELSRRLKENGYQGDTSDIFAIYEWFMTQPYVAYVSGVRQELWDSEDTWTYDIHLYRDKEFMGFKSWTGTYKSAVEDALSWALRETEADREDPDHRAKALAEAVFVPLYES